MTQEELDALMSGDADMDAVDEITGDDSSESSSSDDSSEDLTEENYKVSANSAWPPPPPTDDNKRVHQLDDVTKESEEKASEIFDIIEALSNDAMDAEEEANKISEVFTQNIEKLTTLTEHFPQVATFKEMLQTNIETKEKIGSQVEMLQNNQDQIMTIMDIMQYQDIHRQKIERVINVMRALSTYMNDLFAGSKDDSKRVASAKHIAGDSHNEDVVDNEDIEALLASFGG